MPVIDVTPGIVRNLLKTTYYLRVPHQEVNEGVKHDRHSFTIPLPPAVNVEIFWKDFDAVELELNKLDRDNVVRIIRRPQHLGGTGSAIIVDKDGVVVVPAAEIINFTGNVTVTPAFGNQADVNILSTRTGRELPFTIADWNSTNQLDVIRSGVPVAGQIGPHTLPLGTQYAVSTFKNYGGTRRESVNIETITNYGSGLVQLLKAPLAPAFDGIVVLSIVVP